jgi:primosomal protein N' (replication factor Y)
MLPVGVKKGTAGATVRIVRVLLPTEKLIAHAVEFQTKKPRQAALLKTLIEKVSTFEKSLEESFVPITDLVTHSIGPSVPIAALKALEKLGVIRMEEMRAGHSTDELTHTEGHAHDLTLNTEQHVAYSSIEQSLSAGVFDGFLLQGVTGSGKTEVYLRTLKKALAMGRQGIVLVPEITLTPQTAQRFQQRLGHQRVAVLHSHVTEGDRADAWRDVRAGKIDVVVGARSALFAPLPRLGVIVVDEEHEGAFKQESSPRYHARDVAMELARISQAVLILGTATPSFETLYAAKTGTLKHLHLATRVEGRPMPPVQIVDMGQENRDANRYLYLSPPLLHAMTTTLERREQSILFMNRRGFSTVITCLRCGLTEKCEHCDITLTSHRQAGTHSEKLRCHYCGYEKVLPSVCSGCGMPSLKHWGLGTERIEDEVRKSFPAARIARMDSDTMTRRTSYLDTLSAFRAHQIDILIGTQMIAKGLDFPNVTLVGVVLADTALHMPDFRSRERTFQLLAQVAGRAGRGDKGGRVIIQTFLPDDPAIRAAARHDFETFSLAELQERRTFLYPPFTRLARILIRGKDQALTKAAAIQIGDLLKMESAKQTQTSPILRGAPPPSQILGPSEPPISRLEGMFRQHIMIKARDSQTLSSLLSGPIMAALQKLKGADATVDVDPLSML